MEDPEVVIPVFQKHDSSITLVTQFDVLGVGNMSPIAQPSSFNRSSHRLSERFEPLHIVAVSSVFHVAAHLLR